ncbi:MAG: hypothetical protein U1E17_16500 [Geminicoccaceae bacterium]
MDEPTSSLTPAEFERLAVLIGGLAAQGVAIIYVSHKMDEVRSASADGDDPRDGRALSRTSSSPRPASARWWRVRSTRAGDGGASRFRAGGRSPEVAGLTRGQAVRAASLTLRKGEVLGISAWSAPAAPSLRLIAGIDRPDVAQIQAGRRHQAGSPRARRRRRPRPRPEERKRDGIVARRSVRSNIGLARLRRFARLGFRAPAGAHRAGSDPMRSPQPAPARDRAPIAALGGNRKAIIGRWTPPVPASSCSTSLPAASTSAPRPRSTP